MTSEYIYEVLKSYYSRKQNKYVLRNCFVFGQWEADFFVQTRALLCIEFEVKVSRSDFLADFKHKPLKHLTLKTKKKYGEHKVRQGKTWVKEIKEYPNMVPNIPNYFYYVVPYELIAANEVPEYAGLAYVDKSYQLSIVKKAPKLHTVKHNMEPFLCDKFYYYWQRAMEEVRWKNIENDTLKRNVEALKNKLTSKVV